MNIRIHYSIELNQRPLVSIRSRKKGLGQLLAITPFIDPVPLINQSTPFVCSFKMENSQGCSLCQQSGRVVTPQEPTIKQILGHSSCQKSSENEKGFSVKERPRGPGVLFGARSIPRSVLFQQISTGEVPPWTRTQNLSVVSSGSKNCLWLSYWVKGSTRKYVIIRFLWLTITRIWYARVKSPQDI